MIIDNDPQITRNISIPRDLSSLSCSAFTAGIVEAALDGLGFVSEATHEALLYG
jgi:trafficking protein particle complex subunit 5